jgi:predicted RNase H-like HicB family nuclease
MKGISLFWMLAGNRIISGWPVNLKKGKIMIIETEIEEDGRWIAEISDLPGALAYGKTREDAITKVEALALRILADRLEHGEKIPDIDGLFKVAA